MAYNIINISLINCLLQLPNLSQLYLTDNQIDNEETKIIYDSLIKIVVDMYVNTRLIYPLWYT